MITSVAVTASGHFTHAGALCNERARVMPHTVCKVACARLSCRGARCLYGGLRHMRKLWDGAACPSSSSKRDGRACVRGVCACAAVSKGVR